MRTQWWSWLFHRSSIQSITTRKSPSTTSPWSTGSFFLNFLDSDLPQEDAITKETESNLLLWIPWWWYRLWKYHSFRHHRWTCCCFSPWLRHHWLGSLYPNTSVSFISPVVSSYYRDNKLGRRFISQHWYSSVIAALFDIHHQAWIYFCSATTWKRSTKNIASPQKILSWV